MTCYNCHGLVVWVGPLLHNPEKVCQNCGRKNGLTVEEIQTIQEESEAENANKNT